MNVDDNQALRRTGDDHSEDLNGGRLDLIFKIIKIDEWWNTWSVELSLKILMLGNWFNHLLIAISWYHSDKKLEKVDK